MIGYLFESGYLREVLKMKLAPVLLLKQPVLLRANIHLSTDRGFIPPLGSSKNKEK